MPTNSFIEPIAPSLMDSLRDPDATTKGNLTKVRLINSPKYVVAVDFDGTCVTHEFPKVGKDVRYAVEVLKQIVAHGAGIVLFTMRSGQYLEEAINWFTERGIPLYGINKNPTQSNWTQSPKAYAHLYIDDAALGCPLTFDETICSRPFVDWVGVDKLLQEHHWYIEPIVA